MERLRQMECVSTVKVIVKMASTVIRRLEGVTADVIHIGKDVPAKVFKYTCMWKIYIQKRSQMLIKKTAFLSRCLTEQLFCFVSQNNMYIFSHPHLYVLV